MPNARVCWLVDIGYVVKASEGRFKLDYVGANDLIAARYGPASAFLFNGVDDRYGIPPGLQRFYDEMARRGMTIRLQPMQSGPPGTNRQRRVDVDIAAHLVWKASVPEVETIVLTTGDQDFVPAAEIVREQFDKQLVLFTYSYRAHPDLVASVDERINFEDFEDLLATS